MKFFNLLNIEKNSSEKPNEKTLTDFLNDSEKGYFWNPSEAEMKEWNEFWFTSPVDFRLSPKMPLPPWGLESMYEAFWNGDYDFISITEINGDYHLIFYPHGYPYGGTGSMVALVECFGHRVIGIDDGTGYTNHIYKNIVWMPKHKKYN